MGIFANFLADAKSVDQTPEITALDRVVVRELQNRIDLGDPALPSGFEGADEVQELAASGATAGTFDITVGVRDEFGDQQIAVAGLAWNAAPAAIQTAVDSALAGITGYTAGDVAVTGAGTADLNATVFTYSGDSVASVQHPLSTVDGSGLTGGGTEDFSQTTGGQSGRNVWAIFELYSLVDFGGTPPTQGGSLPTLTETVPESTLFSAATLRAFAREAEIADNIPGLEALLLAYFDLNPLPPASSQG